MILKRSMIGRANKRELFNLIPSLLTILLLVFPSAALHGCGKSSAQPSNGKSIQKTLKDIHDEVLEMGRYRGEDFIKREFWFELDGVEENKEEHVVVLEHNDGLNLRMTVQVTYFTKDKGKRFVRYAEDTKSVFCCLKGSVLEIDKSDYSDEEMEKVLPGILKGIRVEKEILKLIKKEY
jgi:hypothetical protein